MLANEIVCACLSNTLADVTGVATGRLVVAAIWKSFLT